tara:strand:- start:586 stop:780 length:195 start_codon:yes stop_codon:yes gene_type:complete
MKELSDTDLDVLDEALSLYKTKESRAMVKLKKDGAAHRAAGELLTRVIKERRMRRSKTLPTSFC